MSVQEGPTPVMRMPTAQIPLEVLHALAERDSEGMALNVQVSYMMHSCMHIFDCMFQ